MSNSFLNSIKRWFYLLFVIIFMEYVSFSHLNIKNIKNDEL